MKFYHIVSLCVSILCLILISSFVDEDLEAAAGWGVICAIGTIVYAAVNLAKHKQEEK